MTQIFFYPVYPAHLCEFKDAGFPLKACGNDNYVIHQIIRVNPCHPRHPCAIGFVGVRSGDTLIYPVYLSGD